MSPSSGRHDGWPGYPHAILAAELGRFKIGVATRPRDRLRQLQCASPTELVIHSESWHARPGHAEVAAHADLAHARIIGEWFDATDHGVAAWLSERNHDFVRVA